MASVALPVISFSAEIVSMVDGRILARIHERRTPTVAVDMKRQVTIPRTRSSVTGASKLNWGVGCKVVEEVFAGVRDEVTEAMRAKLHLTVSEIVRDGVEELYR